MSLTNILKLCGFLAITILVLGCSPSKEIQEENARQQLAQAQQQTSPVADSTYQIRAGDEIEILVWEQSDFNTTTTVSNQGTIAVPLIGEMEVVGYTHSELKENLRKKLSQYIKGDINLTVSIRSTDAMLVSVFGMVGQPDNYPISNSTSIFKVISMAGGPSDDANIRRIKIYREGGDSNYLTIDLTRYLESGRMSQAAMVNPGDVVYVPQKENAVREMRDFLRDIILLFGIFRVF